MFWGEIVLCATYLINRKPLASLGNISPYKKFLGYSPNNSHLRAFGCVYFISTPQPGRTKFDSRAEPCIFVGYPNGQKAYKVYNAKTHKFNISRDIHFFEHHFPHHYKPSSNILFPKFYLPMTTSISYTDSYVPIPHFPSFPPSAPTDTPTVPTHPTAPTDTPIVPAHPTAPTDTDHIIPIIPPSSIMICPLLTIPLLLLIPIG